MSGKQPDKGPIGIGVQEEKKPSDQPTTTKKSELKAKLVALGYKAGDANKLIKDGLTNLELSEEIIADQRKAPKKK